MLVQVSRRLDTIHRRQTLPQPFNLNPTDSRNEQLNKIPPTNSRSLNMCFNYVEFNFSPSKYTAAFEAKFFDAFEACAAAS